VPLVFAALWLATALAYWWPRWRRLPDVALAVIAAMAIIGAVLGRFPGSMSRSRAAAGGAPARVLAWQADETTVVRTMEGKAAAAAGDWIVQGSAGERWPVKHDLVRPGIRPGPARGGHAGLALVRQCRPDEAAIPAARPRSVASRLRGLVAPSSPPCEAWEL
jgi:hypothetical protein